MTVRAIGLMVLSMALLAMGDGFIKSASLQGASIGQIMVLLSSGGVILFALLARLRGVRILHPAFFEPIVIARNLLEMVAAVGMVVAISTISLSVLAAVMQAGPLLTTLGAALFLGEHVGWRRWLAIAVGIVGMLMVIRPFGAGFTGWEMFAVLGISALAARDLITRMAPPQVPSLALSSWGFMATLLPGGVFLALSSGPVMPSATLFWTMMGAAVVTALGYLAITTAMRMAPASIVAPFRYTRLVFTTGIGVALFGDIPDVWTLLGGALILSAGLYSFLRERRLARQDVSA